MHYDKKQKMIFIRQQSIRTESLSFILNSSRLPNTRSVFLLFSTSCCSIIIWNLSFVPTSFAALFEICPLTECISGALTLDFSRIILIHHVLPYLLQITLLQLLLLLLQHFELIDHVVVVVVDCIVDLIDRLPLNILYTEYKYKCS
jgi:hypothetical protein